MNQQKLKDYIESLTISTEKRLIHSFHFEHKSYIGTGVSFKNNEGIEILNYVKNRKLKLAKQYPIEISNYDAFEAYFSIKNRTDMLLEYVHEINKLLGRIGFK